MAELLGISLPLIPKTIIDYKAQVKNIENTFENNLEKTKSSLAEGLDLPLWNFSPEDVKNLLKATTNSSAIKKVSVWDNQKKLFAEASDKNWIQSTENLKEFQTSNIEIVHEGRSIGSAEIIYTKTELETKKMSALRYLILGNTLAIFLIILLTSALMRLTVIRKIFTLKNQFKKLENKELSESFDWKDGDEINSLGMSLESARKTLNKLFEDLEKSNQNLFELNNNLESQVIERSNQLSESSRLASLGEMAGGVAHEINNPLAIISGKARKLRKLLAARNLVGIENEIKELNSIDATIERISKIIRGLRTFSRDGSQDNFENIKIKSLIDDTLEMCKARFTNHSIEIRIKEFDPELSIDCRSVQLGQVILNLLSNAYDALADKEEKWVEIAVSTQADKITIQITDSGPGIPEAIRAKLMQPFFTTKPVGKGTGLGLSISKGIIDAHGGKFEIDEKCPNTRFIIELPIKATPNEKKEAA
jgi:C4-dicarboxylate-specific signal transduction histidine kinase